MSKWQDISTAPKDGTPILIFGRIEDHPKGMIRFLRNGIYTGYYEPMDSAFCVSAATWTGAFIEATHWMPLPSPPAPNSPVAS